MSTEVKIKGPCPNFPDLVQVDVRIWSVPPIIFLTTKPQIGFSGWVILACSGHTSHHVLPGQCSFLHNATPSNHCLGGNEIICSLEQGQLTVLSPLLCTSLCFVPPGTSSRISLHRPPDPAALAFKFVLLHLNFSNAVMPPSLNKTQNVKQRKRGGSLNRCP